MNFTFLPRCVRKLLLTSLFTASISSSLAFAQQEVKQSELSPVKLFEVDRYTEGVVFDHKGDGYISWDKTITKFTLKGDTSTFAVTGAPNGHKILADGTHLVCDASQHAILKLDADGKMLEPASKSCNGKPLRGPNDLTLDPKGGFYFTDPGESSAENPIGTVHYVDTAGVTHLVADKIAFPNGIVLTEDGKTLLVAESQRNRVLAYPVVSPGKVGAMSVFADLPKSASGKWEDNQPDGMCLDAQGNLYVAHYGMKQVQVLDPKGTLIRQYDGGNQLTSNVAFGGPNRDQLFVTGSIKFDGTPGAVFRLDIKTVGRLVLPKK